jgi:hypothetical protein
MKRGEIHANGDQTDLIQLLLLGCFGSGRFNLRRRANIVATSRLPPFCASFLRLLLLRLLRRVNRSC